MDVKHTLRDWIEGRLSGPEQHGDASAFAAALNKELQSADLFCEQAGNSKEDRCRGDPAFDWNATGFLQPIRLERENGVLTVVTSVGILCGGDESAYVYARQGASWRRVLADEQQIAEQVPYWPPHITAVRVSWPDEKSRDRMVLILGHGTWCTSAWSYVSYHLWRVDPRNSEPKRLLDRMEGAFLAHNPPIVGSVSAADATLEFTAGSLDVDEHSYNTVRHYAIRADGIRRTDPFALRPRSFVEDWLRADQPESLRWASASANALLRSWHEKLRGSSGNYLGSTQRCRKKPELWQVGIALMKPGEPPTAYQNTYFIIRWRPPYRFRMEQISTTPRADCDQPDKAADEQRTLFAGWR